jgi:hypothetical protein
MAWEQGGGGGEFEELAPMWGAGRAMAQGNEGRSDNDSSTWAMAPLQREQQWVTGRRQRDLGNGTTATGVTTPAQRGGYQLGSFSSA